LRVAEVEGGARRAGFTVVELNALVVDVAELYELVAEGNGVSLSLSTEAAPGPGLPPRHAAKAA
jgi:hypothetical protein